MVNFNDVPPGSYTIALRAANAAGISASSNAITLSVPAVCSGAPLTPERYLAYRQGNTIAAFWDPAATGPAPTNYLVEVSGAFTGTFSTAGRFLSSLADPGTYSIQVRAQNACGSSAPTPAQTIVVP